MQRTSGASVSVQDQEIARIGTGIVLLVGVSKEDARAEARWLAEKVANLRIFNDEEGKMNLSLQDIGGEALVVSQFTLYGDARKGRRPSFVSAAGAGAEQTYLQVVRELEGLGITCRTGRFGAMMQVALTNDGPVTILLDSDKTF